MGSTVGIPLAETFSFQVTFFDQISAIPSISVTKSSVAKDDWKENREDHLINKRQYITCQSTRVLAGQLSSIRKFLANVAPGFEHILSWKSQLWQEMLNFHSEWSRDSNPSWLDRRPVQHSPCQGRTIVWATICRKLVIFLKADKRDNYL